MMYWVVGVVLLVVLAAFLGGYYLTEVALRPRVERAEGPYLDRFAEHYPNLTVRTDGNPAFRHITYSVIQNDAVVVSKNKCPTIHFIINHKKMVQAFQNFTPPVTIKDISKAAEKAEPPGR